MDREEIKGKAQKAKGFVKEKAGEITDNPDLQAEGAMDRAEGSARDTFGKARRKVKDGIEEIADEAEDLDDE
ncbi:MAG TPA: CsbD family protein [Methylomirabilota bacterium]|nr:CsbD family protein [Methylomirabilota bacterium]